MAERRKLRRQIGEVENALVENNKMSLLSGSSNRKEVENNIVEVSLMISLLQKVGRKFRTLCNLISRAFLSEHVTSESPEKTTSYRGLCTKA